MIIKIYSHTIQEIGFEFQEMIIAEDLNVSSNEALITPEKLKTEMPLTGPALESVTDARDDFSILDRKDPRMFFVVVGPCSIHDTEAALDYAKRLKILADKSC